MVGTVTVKSSKISGSDDATPRDRIGVTHEGREKSNVLKSETVKTLNCEKAVGGSENVAKGVDTPTGALVLGASIVDTTKITNLNLTASVTVNLAFETTFDEVVVVGVVTTGMGCLDPLN